MLGYVILKFLLLLNRLKCLMESNVLVMYWVQFCMFSYNFDRRMFVFENSPSRKSLSRYPLPNLTSSIPVLLPTMIYFQLQLRGLCTYHFHQSFQVLPPSVSTFSTPAVVLNSLMSTELVEARWRQISCESFSRAPQCPLWCFKHVWSIDFEIFNQKHVNALFSLNF